MGKRAADLQDGAKRNHQRLQLQEQENSTAETPLEKRFGGSTLAGRVLVAEERGGSLPRQVCVIVAVANTVITGGRRRERKRERERGGG